MTSLQLEQHNYMLKLVQQHSEQSSSLPKLDQKKKTPLLVSSRLVSSFYLTSFVRRYELTSFHQARKDEVTERECITARFAPLLSSSFVTPSLQKSTATSTSQIRSN